MHAIRVVLFALKSWALIMFGVLCSQKLGDGNGRRILITVIVLKL
jgi:hypothetical protein